VRSISAILCCLLLAMSSCRKDYPSDIPGWVEDRIHDCRKVFHNCNSLDIIEYKGLGQRWFYFNQRENDGADELYDEGGSLICSGHNMFIYEEQCPVIVLDSLHMVRSVWSEK
jgi:hypothetical protein